MYTPPPLLLFDNFEAQVLARFQLYRVPIIELLRETPKEAVCHVFEKVNMGGVPLSVFELVTASFAADDFPFGRTGTRGTNGCTRNLCWPR